MATNLICVAASTENAHPAWSHFVVWARPYKQEPPVEKRQFIPTAGILKEKEDVLGWGNQLKAIPKTKNTMTTWIFKDDNNLFW